MTIKTDRRRVHGYSLRKHISPEYCAYRSAKDRCTRAKHPYFGNYGGRGIEFRFASFVDFLAAIGPRPALDLTLDRVDNDGHYEPGNVRWATRLQQTHNRRPRRRQA